MGATSGAFGLAGSIAGCATTASAAIGGAVAKKKGWLKESEELARLRRIFVRDVQPAVDLFLRTYLGVKAPAINVLTIQKKIEAAQTNAQRSQGIPKKLEKPKPKKRKRRE